MEQKNGKEWSGFDWDFIYFQWENWPYKNTKINNQMYLQAPQKVWNFRKQKKNMLSTCHKWIKRKWKERCESNGFCTTLWGTTYPSSWWFLKLWQLWALFICCVHQNSFAANMYMNFYYLYMNFCYSYSNIERGPLWLRGAPFFEWGPLFMWDCLLWSGALSQLVKVWLSLSQYPFSAVM